MSSDIQQALYQQFSRIGKAIANEHRLRLIDLLAQGERSVSALAEAADLSVANASQHLQVLHQARLVETRKEGTSVLYRLASDSVLQLWQALREVGVQRLAEINRIMEDYAHDKEALRPIGMEELRDRMETGSVEVIDVRPEEEYESGHIAGARSVPLEELEEHIEQLPDDTEIVAYCRGPYCVLSSEAVQKLRENGRVAHRLDFGYPEWEAADLPTDAEANGTSASA